MISVILIVKNEQDKIAECLQSVKWADEIVVIDAHSEDQTVKLCQQFTDKVTISDWAGFGPQKNKALALATQPWVLSVDADERVSLALKQEIMQIIRNSDSDEGYEIPRQSNYCGQWIKHSGWSPDFVLRLFKRQNARFSDDTVHERVLLNADASIGQLKNPLQHFPFDNLEQVLDKINFYSSAWAQDKHKQKVSSSLTKALLHSAWSFSRTYFIQKGFLDGQAGLMLAISNAQGTYYKYAKLAKLSQDL